VRIAVGKLVAGSGDELAVLDGSDLYVYEMSGAEPRLLNSFTVSIPPASVRHREDAGSLELIDLDGNGLDEICIAPPGGSRGEVWRLGGAEWAPVGFLPLPARAVAPQSMAVLVGQYLTGLPALDSTSLSWFYPLTQKEPTAVALGFSPIAVAAIPEATTRLPDLLAVNKSGALYRVPAQGPPVSIPGTWGDCIRTGITRSGAVAILTKPSLGSDELTIVDLATESVLATYPYPDGPIIDIAVGDTNRDGKSEIIVAAVHPEGVRIYY
jgi:hypothetical protein